MRPSTDRVSLTPKPMWLDIHLQKEVVYDSRTVSTALPPSVPPSLPPSLPLALTKILHVAATFAMVVGSELHERTVLPMDHFLLQAIVNAAVSHSWKCVWSCDHCLSNQLLSHRRHHMIHLWLATELHSMLSYC